MQYRLKSDKEDELLGNIFNRYSMVRALALTEACRIVRLNMSSGTPQQAAATLRDLVSKEIDRCTDKDTTKRKMTLDTFKLGDIRKLSQV